MNLNIHLLHYRQTRKRNASSRGLIIQVDVASGERKLFKEFLPSDPTGVKEIGEIRMTADAKYYAYSYQRFVSTLYILSDLR